MFKNHKAYTLWEILITLVIVAILLALIAPSILKGKEVNERRLMGLTANFYQSVENALVYLRENKNMKDSDGDGALTKVDFKDYFVKTIGGDPNAIIDCSLFATHVGNALQNVHPEPAEGEEPDEEGDVSEDLVCAEFESGVTAGFYYEPACNLTVVAKEYFTPTPEGETPQPPRTVTNACGFIVYTTKDTMKYVGSGEVAELGANIFTIATGDGYVK